MPFDHQNRISYLQLCLLSSIMSASLHGAHKRTCIRIEFQLQTNAIAIVFAREEKAGEADAVAAGAVE